MKEIIIAFDVDGTILNNEGIPPKTPVHARPPTPVNLEVVLLMELLAKYMKNTRIIVWSGGGKQYAEEVVRRYGLERYVSAVYGKPQGTHGLMSVEGAYDESIWGPVDICFDDIHSCSIAEKNIIVKMK